MKVNEMKIKLTRKEAEYAALLCLGNYAAWTVCYNPHFAAWFNNYFAGAEGMEVTLGETMQALFGRLCSSIAAKLDPEGADISATGVILSESEAEHVFMMCVGSMSHLNDKVDGDNEINSKYSFVETTTTTVFDNEPYHPTFRTWAMSIKRIRNLHRKLEDGYQEDAREYFGRLCTAIAEHLDPDFGCEK